MKPLNQMTTIKATIQIIKCNDQMERYILSKTSK